MTANDARAEALAANEAFYRAFTMRDVAAMDRLWARAAEITCIHPGWNALVGRPAVLESWAAILANPQAPRVRCLHARASIDGGVARVVCYEVIEQGVLVATNLFVLEEGGWKICHHQSGPASGEGLDFGTGADKAPASQRLH